MAATGVPGYAGGLKIMNVSDTSNPALVGIGDAYMVSMMEIENKFYALVAASKKSDKYLITYGYSLKIIEVSDP